MGIRIFNNLPPYIEDLSNNVRKFEIYLKHSYIHIFFTPEKNIFNINLLQVDNVP